MATSLYLKKQDFPDIFAAVNRLADLIKLRTGVRPSVRKLSAEILWGGANKRIAEIETEIQSADTD